MECPNQLHCPLLVYAKSEKSQDVRSKVLFLDKNCSLKLFLIAETPFAHGVDDRAHRFAQLTEGVFDPILHPDFWRLLELFKQRGIPFTILGNPFHLDGAVCRCLKDCGCEKYQLSIDGLRETHDWFRKPGSFDTTLEKIGCINRAGIRSVVMTTVSGKNIDEVPGIIDAVVKAGVNVFAFARYCPTSEEKDTGIEPLRYRQLLADCDKKFKEYEAAGCNTYFNKKDHLWT